MNTISVCAMKGGSGKSTIALHLAVASELAGHPTVVIDLDPQVSATEWSDSREASAPVVLSAVPKRVGPVLTTACEGGAKLAVIDTAPHSSDSTALAIRASSLVLIPVRPSIFDLRAIGATVDLAAQASKRAVAVLNAVPARGSLVNEARSAISQYGIEVAPVTFGQRLAFQHAITAGLTAPEYEPHGKASEETTALYKWVIAQVRLC